MKKFFSKDKNYSLLFKESKLWEGVRYQHMGNNKAGVDCTKLCAFVYKNIGIISHVEEEIYYSKDWYWHGEKQIAVEAFRDHLEKYLKEDLTYSIFPFDEENIYRGDVIFLSMKDGRPCNHTIMIHENNQFFHAINQSGCHFAHFDKTHYYPKCKYILRIFYKEN